MNKEELYNITLSDSDVKELVKDICGGKVEYDNNQQYIVKNRGDGNVLMYRVGENIKTVGRLLKVMNSVIFLEGVESGKSKINR